jgi:1-deoxy-D-xylulose-5-phosphate synthase
MTPSNAVDCFQMLSFGYNYNGICAVRYPRGISHNRELKKTGSIKFGSAKKIRIGKSIAILAFGTIVNTCIEIAEDINATLVDMRFVKPIDKKMIKEISLSHDFIVTVEENVVSGGAGSAVLEALSEMQLSCKTLVIGIPDKFFEHGSQKEVLEECGLDRNAIKRKIVKQHKEC